MNTTTSNIKRPKLLVKFNIIDILIILVIIAGVFLVLYKAGVFGKQPVVETSAVISFTIGEESGIRDTTAPFFSVGDNLFLTSDVSAGAEPVGTIMTARTSPHTEERVIDGETVLYTYPSESPTRVEISGTMRLTGTYGDGGFYIGGKQFIAVGGEVYLCTDKVDFYIKVLSVDVEE